MSADETVRLLRERYPLDKGFVSLAEVAPPGGEGRYDFLAISVFRSHGYSVQGFEIKASRADFLAEIRNPAKSAPLHRWCDRWWMVAPLECGSPEECPPDWGFIAVKDGQLRQVRKAKVIVPEERGDAWWATCLLRQATKRQYQQDELQQAESKGWQEGNQHGEEMSARAVKHLEERMEEQAKTVRDFEAASGISIYAGWNGSKKIGEAVRMLVNGRTGFEEVAERIGRAAADLAGVASALKDIAARPEIPEKNLSIADAGEEEEA